MEGHAQIAETGRVSGENVEALPPEPITDPHKSVDFVAVRTWVYTRVVPAVSKRYGIRSIDLVRPPWNSRLLFYQARAQAAQIIAACVRFRSEPSKHKRGRRFYNIMEQGQHPSLPMATLGGPEGRSLWARISTTDMGLIFRISGVCIGRHMRQMNREYGIALIPFGEYKKGLGHPVKVS